MTKDEVAILIKILGPDEMLRRLLQAPAEKDREPESEHEPGESGDADQLVYELHCALNRLGFVRLIDVLKTSPQAASAAASAEPAATPVTPQDRLVRELIVGAIEDYKRSLSFKLRVDEARRPTAKTDPSGWASLRQEADNLVVNHEAALAYALEGLVPGMVGEGGRVLTDEGEFEPFGVSHDGLAFIVRHDPGNMNAGIITMVELDRLIPL